MAIHLDTSVLVATMSETPIDDEWSRLMTLIEREERIAFSSLVLYEWLRPPRTQTDIDGLDELFELQQLVVFGEEEAEMAATLYRRVSRPRGRELDIGIAACALVHGATLWTLNKGDFSDIPGLTLL